MLYQPPQLRTGVSSIPREVQIFHRSTAASLTDTNLDMSLGEGVYIIHSASVRTQSEVANQAAFSIQWTTSDGTTQTDNLKSGFVQLHQHLAMRHQVIMGPGIFRAQVLKEDASASHFFVIYEQFSQREWTMLHGGI